MFFTREGGTSDASESGNRVYFSEDYVMDLTAMDEATDEQKSQGLVEWAKAFKAESWEEVREIDNPAVKEAAKTMELIMSNPTENRDS